MEACGNVLLLTGEHSLEQARDPTGAAADLTAKESGLLFKT